MAGRQRHTAEVGRIPRRNDVAARVGIAPETLDETGDLVDLAAVAPRPGTPLMAIDRPELALRIGPLVPDLHAVLAQVGDVGAPGEKPDELVHDRLQVQLLRRDQREALAQIEPHLMAEEREGSGPGPVRLLDAAVEDLAQEVEVGSQGPHSLANPPPTSQLAATGAPRQLFLPVWASPPICRLRIRQ